jgi:hypothetical protein
MIDEKKGPSVERYRYLYDKISEIIQDENHDNLIPALTGLLCQVVADSEHDKKHFLSYFADTLDREFEEAKKDGRQH